MTSSQQHDVARRIVSADGAFASVVKAVGPPPSRKAIAVKDRFPAVISAITSQLLSIKAAETIHARVVSVLNNDVTPTTVAAASVEDLRLAGLSTAKARTMIALAEETIAGTIHFEKHGRLSEEEVAREITSVRGIGPWTAHMYLMFSLARPNVWPVGDLGVRHGWSLLHNLPDLIEPKLLSEEGRLFDGDLSSVAWYCWQAVHLSRGE
jgi:DNA-3-methyladenine glycosylase II